MTVNNMGLWLTNFQQGVIADIPTTFDGEGNIAFYWATDTFTLYVAGNPGVGGTVSWKPVGGAGAPATVEITDANTTLLAANSGKPHLVANVSADRTFTLPSPVDGLDFEFIATVGAADGHDWIITTGSDTNFFLGAITHLDTDSDAAGDEVVNVSPNGSSNSKLQINLPQGGTRVRVICDGTNWIVSGVAVSATAPAFADQ